MLSVEELVQALSFGYEVRGFELKRPGPRTDTHLFAKVTRAALSMANLRDGGHIIIGVDDKDPVAMLPGLSAEDLASWLSYDDVSRKLAEYADPPLHFDIAARALSTGADVALLQVHEFADIPVLCAKDFPEVLRKGACYVRPRRVPETAEIPSAVEMRDLLQLATEKALRAFVETAARSGIELVTPEQADDVRERAAERFSAQREQTW